MKLPRRKRPRFHGELSRLRQQLVSMVEDVQDFECAPLIELENMMEILRSVIKERKEVEQSNSKSRDPKRRKTSTLSLTIVTAQVVPPSPDDVRTLSAACVCRDLHPEVLRLIANTGFLRSHDLGRLLLLTKKAFVQDLTPNFVFQLLYETRMKDRWASPTCPHNEWIPRNLVGNLVRARGHESVLRAMESFPMVKRNIVALPHVVDAKLNSENTIFIVSFWVLSQNIFSRRLHTTEVDRLTKTGHCRIPVGQGSLFQISKLCLEDGKMFAKELRKIQQKNSISSSRKHASGALITAKIHAIRRDTNETCSLYDSSLPRFEMQRTHLQGSPRNSNDEDSNNITVVFPIQRALKNTPAGDQLVARWFQGWPEGIQNFGGLSFGITLCKGCFHVDSKVFGATGVQSESLRTRNGVSPFHILEGLAGWH